MSRPFTRLGTIVLGVAGLLALRPLADHVPERVASPRPMLALALQRAEGETSVVVDRSSPLRNELVALADAMRSGSLRIAGERIEISGIANASGPWPSAFAAFQQSLPAGIDIDVDVFVINESLDSVQLCERMFDSISDANVEFRHSGAALRASSTNALERVASFAVDCPSHNIAIIGHSDASGDAQYNRTLSEDRARAVAYLLIARGIDAARLIVEGRGASEPIADNATVAGRARNRRIEFELRPAASLRTATPR